ncbi:MAG: LysM domain-containing protein, partial [Chloroflexi bacterium]
NMAVTGPERAAPPADSGRQATYIVQPGDYLAELARRFGLHWMDIANLNGLVYPYVIYSGQELKLPGAIQQPEPTPTPVPPTPEPETAPQYVDLKNAVWLPLIIQAVPEGQPVPAEPAAPPPDPVPTEYTVQKGEYLIELARRYNLNWEDIARLNNLWWPFTLYPGQVLKLK